MSRQSKTQKSKRRADKLALQAWSAVEEGDLQLAKKIIKRATDERPANPLLWLDLGLISGLQNEDADAEKAFQSAIFLAPSLVEAYIHLAALYARQGKVSAAERLQRRAVSLSPKDTEQQEKLEVYQAMLSTNITPTKPSQTINAPLPAQEELSLGRYDWENISTELRSRGCALLPRLLSPEHCQQVSGLHQTKQLFEKTITMSGAQGQGSYHFFALPLPALVSSLREEVYERLAPIANHWNKLLQRQERYPASLREFTAYCHQEGQHKTTPILLHYEAGGFNAPHQDIWGRVSFPFQLAVTLSDGFSGGEFLLVEDAPGKKALRIELPTRQGDGVLFCSQHRLIKLGDVFALQAVRHGVLTITSGERFALGIPFHEYK
jgi:hypothetical protein